MSEAIQQETQEENKVNLSLADLATAIQAIQLAAQRGAYRAEEFKQIGSCFENIFAFLDANGAIKRPEAEGSAEGESQADEA